MLLGRMSGCRAVPLLQHSAEGYDSRAVAFKSEYAKKCVTTYLPSSSATVQKILVVVPYHDLRASSDIYGSGD